MTLGFEGSEVKVFPEDYTAALSLVPTDGSSCRPSTRRR